MKSRFAALLLAGIMTLSLVACGQQAAENTASTSEPETIVEQPSIPEGVLAIAEQGMFSAGGTVITSDGTFDVSNYYTSREGSTAHVDHANVLYQIPAEETGLPMVFLHGYGQSRMGWMTTPDGREGWSDMFLKMGHSVFLIDQPRRGEAGQTSVAGTINTEPSDQTWYTQFRIGTYLNDEFTYNEGSQFPAGEEALDQFFRQMTPDTGMDNAGGDQNIDNTVVAQAVAATIDEVYARTGKDSILVTHSQGGMPGWETARYTAMTTRHCWKRKFLSSSITATTSVRNLPMSRQQPCGALWPPPPIPLQQAIQRQAASALLSIFLTRASLETTTSCSRT